MDKAKQARQARQAAALDGVAHRVPGWRWPVLLWVAGLAACGGGGEVATTPDGGGTMTPPPVSPTSVFAAQEAGAVADDPRTYAVLTGTVLQGSVITRDTATATFANVNADTDPDDALEPEIDAHIVLDGYPDDAKPLNATIRLRGHSSRLAEQKSYRVKLLKTAALWRGEQTLQFNKHPWDLTRVRNKLAMDLFRDIPHVPSLRTQFVRLSLTNQDKAGVPYASADFGLFTHVEKMGKEYLGNRGLPTDGNVYKAEDFSFRSDARLALTAAGAPVNKATFERVLSLEADSGDHTRLLAMLVALGDPASDFETVFGRYFDRSNYLTWLATSVLMGNRDTTTQNFGLYQPKGSDKFYFLPWDYDGALGYEDQADVALDASLYAPWQKTLANWWDVPLHRRFLSDPKRVAELKQAVEELYTRHLGEAALQARLAVYQPLVAPYVTAAPDLTWLPGVTADRAAEWRSEVSRIAAAPRLNRERFLSALDQPMPFFQAVTAEAGGHRLTWDAATDLQGDAVTYRVELATAPDFASGSVVVSRSGLGATELLVPKLADGSYYLRVSAVDAKGNTQQAFDRVSVGGKTWFGVLGLVVRGAEVAVR
jgi:spore coat protein H